MKRRNNQTVSGGSASTAQRKIKEPSASLTKRQKALIAGNSPASKGSCLIAIIQIAGGFVMLFAVFHL